MSRAKSPTARLEGEARTRWETRLTQTQRDEIDEAFSLILQNEDASMLDVDHIRQVMLALGHDESMLGSARGGQIRLEDFCEALSQRDAAFFTTCEAQLREAFMVFDKNGNDEVDAPELQHVLKNLGFDLSDEETDEMLVLADMITRNNVMTFDEWCDTLRLFKEKGVQRSAVVAMLVQVARVGRRLWPFWTTLGDPIDFLEAPLAFVVTVFAPTILGGLEEQRLPFVASLRRRERAHARLLSARGPAAERPPPPPSVLAMAEEVAPIELHTHRSNDELAHDLLTWRTVDGR